MKSKKLFLLLPLPVLAILLAWFLTRPPRQIWLTGIVTTDEVIVSSQIQGRLEQLRVREGDLVQSNQLVGLIEPREWRQDMAFYSNSEQQVGAQVVLAEADLKYEAEMTSNQIGQAEANLAAAQAQINEAKADLENARLTYKREETLYQRHVDSAQAFEQARAAYEAGQARVESLCKQALAAEAGVALAKANQEQVAARRASLEATIHQRAAADAQKDKARTRLDYTEIRAPINGLVDVRAALQGEVVSPGQAIVTLINPDNLWVRADVEETYIDQILLGDTLTVRLPSGAERPGKVFYRGIDAGFATQRDVSRTKRDIKTFEIRLRCKNADRSLAVGMSAYVALPLH